MEGEYFYMKIKSILLVALLPMIVGCSNGAQPTGEDVITVTDMQNREVSFDRNSINRVVCIGAGALRFYSYIGDMSKIVASEDIDGPNTFGIGQTVRPYYLANKDYLSTLPSIGKGGPQAQTAETELILAQRPDMVISFLDSVEANNALGQLVPVIALKQGREGIFDSVTMQSFELLGKVFKRETKYNEIKQYVESCKADFANLTVDPNVTYYGSCIAGWGNTNFLLAANNWPVFKYAKVKNIMDNISDDKKTISQMGATISMETILEANPDKVFIDGAGYNTFVNTYKTDASYKEKIDNIAAFRNGEVYKMLPYNAYYTNLEIQLMTTYYVASIAHPESFANFDIATKCDEISVKFNGKAMYDTLKAQPTGVGGYGKVDMSSL